MDGSVELIDLLSGVATSRDSNGRRWGGSMIYRARFSIGDGGVQIKKHQVLE